MKLNLTWRLALFLVGVILAAGLGSVLLALSFDLSYHRRLLINHTQTLANLASELARYPLSVRDRAEANRLLQALARLPGLKEAAILDDACQVWVGRGDLLTGCSQAGQALAVSWESLLSKTELTWQVPVLASVGREAALFDGAEQAIGYILLRFDLTEFQSRIRHLSAWVLGALLVLLALVLMVALWYVRVRLLAPLMELHVGFRRLMQGQAYPLAVPKTSPEIQSLHQGFNKVLDWLEDYRSRLEQLAFCDSLTGLGNRAFLTEQLRQLLSLSQRQGFSLALLFLDLDRFKFINDALGHGTGDLLLVEVGAGLRRQLRGEDVIVRMGGDEFVILLPALGADLHQARWQAQAAADKILGFFSQPIELNGHQVTVSCSIGIALYPHDAQDAETLLRHADSALYQAKEAGRNTYRFFHRQLAVLAYRHLTLESALRQAVRQHALAVYLQPQVEYPGGCIVGAEALLRWNVEGNFVPPSEFVPLLEETGLIFEVTEWLIAQVMTHKHRWWQRAWLGKLQHLAVNLSPIHLWRRDLIERLVPLLCRDERCPTQLELELTESALLQPTPQLLQTLEELRQAKIRLAIDDFGTGYSNLAQLKHLPLDALKIDQAFVRDLVHPTGLALVKAICALGESLEVKLIAEGVETKEQAETLSQLGCRIMQGFHFYRPMPLEEFAALLAHQADRCG